MIKQVNNERGLTLLEVLAASILLVGIVLLFMNITGFTSLVNKKEDIETKALHAAKEHLVTVQDAMSRQEAYPTNITKGPFQIVVTTTAFSTPVEYEHIQHMDKHLSLQTLYFQSGQFILVTITVSWEDG